MLAGEIPQDLRDLTVHDITHLDALWETAGIIAGDEVEFTPVEAFVLGGAFLIHDLGLALAAFPNGMASLMLLPRWKDLIISVLRRRLRRHPSKDEVANPPGEVAEEAKFLMLRELHGERAEKLATFSWRTAGVSYHLIENPELRASLGGIIGRIAHSHAWPVDRVGHEFDGPPQGAPATVPLPSSWTLDSLKLALVMRLADAAHVDARRAPAFLRTVRSPRVPSGDHWIFQGRLNQVRRQNDRLVYTGQAFPVSEAQSWWLCSDTLRMIDCELREADNLNANLRRVRFAATGVLAVEEPIRLAKLIPTEGWVPVDAQIKVGRVASLVRTLGGSGLYGDDQTVPLRELIQNGSDAVRARRILENQPEGWGNIFVRVGKDSFGPWVEVEDQGVGMSAEVLTGQFLDFGASLWTSPEVTSEFPSLLAKGFESAGKFGIGFFSVFMWGDKVRVTTQRYDEAKESSRVLEFEHGLETRPLLRRAQQSEWLLAGGTRIRVWPKDVDDISSEWLRIPSDLLWEAHTSPLRAAYWLCPAVDVNLRLEDESGNQQLVVQASDWKTIPGEELLERLTSMPKTVDSKEAGNNVRPIIQGGQVVGRGCILPMDAPGIVIVGGLRSLTNTAIAGVLTGESTSAARYEADIHATSDSLAIWASEQAKLVPNLTTDLRLQAQCAQVVAALGGDVGTLPIGRIDNRWVNTNTVTSWAKDKRSVFVISPTDEEDISLRWSANLKANVILEPTSVPDVVQQRLAMRFRRPINLDRFSDWQRDKKIRRPIVRAVAQAWSLQVSEVAVWSGDMDIGDNQDVIIDCEELRKPNDDPE